MVNKTNVAYTYELFREVIENKMMGLPEVEMKFYYVKGAEVLLIVHDLGMDVSNIFTM